MKRLLLCVFFLLLCTAPALAEIEISEVMASNGVYINGEAYDWVELHNTGKKTVDLSGCYLSDSKKKPTKWAFPKNTSPEKNQIGKDSKNTRNACPTSLATPFMNGPIWS